jgi:hypothetical protein
MATNETGRPSIVSPPPRGDSAPPARFGFDVMVPHVHLVNHERAADPGAIRFAVGETKRWVADIPASEFTPGAARFYGMYDKIRRAIPLSVVVLP